MARRTWNLVTLLVLSVTLFLFGRVAAQPPEHSGPLHDRVAEVAAEAETLRRGDRATPRSPS